MSKIILKDGTELENLSFEGGCFISDYEITSDTFKGKLTDVKIVHDEGEEIYENAKLTFIQNISGKYYFQIIPYSIEELEKIKMKSDIEYIAMMTDISL